MSKWKIPGSWVPHRLKMLQSHAWAALTPAARKLLDRLEIEYMRNAGKTNGRLVVTYADFQKHGIRYPSIPDAKRLVIELGFVRETKTGWRSPDRANPSEYAVTYLPIGNAAPTDEWKAYMPATATPKTARKIQFTGYENVTCTGYENVTGVPPPQPEKQVTKTLPLSRSLATAAPGEGLEEKVGAEPGAEMAMAAELPVPFASGVLRRRRNRLLSTTMLTPRHATGGEIRKMIMAGPIGA